MNIYKTRPGKQFIHIVKNIKFSYGEDKIKNLTHLKDVHVNPLKYKNAHKITNQKQLIKMKL